MFLVDQQFRLDVPQSLRNPGTELFHVVESTMDLPIWIARVLDAGGQHAHPRYRRFFVHDVMPALRILRMGQWSERILYVLLPGYLNGAEEWSLQRCIRVWKCDEPDGVGACWRLDLGSGPMLVSASGTSLGQEINPTLAWRDSKK